MPIVSYTEYYNTVGITGVGNNIAVRLSRFRGNERFVGGGDNCGKE